MTDMQSQDDALGFERSYRRRVPRSLARLVRFVAWRLGWALGKGPP